MKSFYFLLFTCLLFTIHSNAQSKTGTSNSMPDWVAMIDNPATNYYVAVKSFNAYWKDRPEPEGDEDEGKMSKEEKEKHEEFEKRRRVMTPAERQLDDQINYQFKRFKNWANEIKPFVQDDGRILSMDERIAIWNQQQLELKNKR